MNIIFGKDSRDIPDMYTVLELDTFRMPPDGNNVTAYCVVERIGLPDFPLLDATRQLHHDVIRNYKLQHWDYCERAINDGLMGRWNGELDTFYQELLTRIGRYRSDPPGADWDGVVDRTQTK